MAGNLQADNSGNILVDFDYNNIIIVDPNKTIDAFGKISERLVDQENLVMFANLEAELLPRTKLAVGASPDDRLRTISVGKINFLKPNNGKYFGTGYYDELTGLGANKNEGVNQPKEYGVIPNNGDKAYIVNTVNNENNILDNGLLGITSINIKTSTSFIPTVSIEMEDVQGKALFQLGNNSPYAAFFNLPYPPFYLTLKGYYGQAIRYQLNLETFTADFNSYSGNYKISLTFRGYKFNILNEISMGHLLAAPHMYSTTFDVTSSPTVKEGSTNNGAKSSTNNVPQNNVGSDNKVTQIISERGYQKVVEIYSEYKSKLLIPADFPELTLVQLMNKIQNFITNISSSFTKVDVEPLTNIRNYKEKLKLYFERIRGVQSSWFNTYLDNKPIILKDKTKVYVFKKQTQEEKDIAESLLKSYIITYNDQLSENPTLGKSGKYPITNDIKYDMMLINVTSSQIDWVETVRQQTGISTPTENQTKEVIKRILDILTITTLEVEFNGLIPIVKNVVLPKFFIFESEKRFDKTIADMDAQANKKQSEIEQKLTLEIASKIEDKSSGIGFTPTVRNITAVIMANAEAFIRLLDDVHTNAWDQKYNSVRKNAILDNPSSVPGTDNVEIVKTSEQSLSNNSNSANSQQPVYPWPQFFVETPEDKKGRFQLKYIADPSVVDLTQGWNYVAWPEVEFVEEFMKGLTQKLNPPVSQPPTETDKYTIITNINAIEFPNFGIAYVNKEQIKFFYEIWERQYLSAFYSGFIRVTNNTTEVQYIRDLNLQVESENIKNSLGTSSPFLTLALKQYNITAENYVEVLSNMSNQGTGKSYQDFIRDFFVTPYIKNITNNSFNILSVNDLGREYQYSSNEYNTKLSDLVKNTNNTPFIVDTIPFRDYSWNLKNMSVSLKNVNELVYNTNKVLSIFPSRNVIANFTDINDFTKNRPVTNFSFLKVKNPIEILNTTTLNEFYRTRLPNDFIPTEAYCQYDSPLKTLPNQKTTSILNTPYFINAIQNGVYNWKRGDNNPYVQAAYLFINSLPLASLRERYKTLNSVNDLDYIASCFKKFGAIHKVPYAWVLKYGSIWHRYKKFKETGVDVLSDAWKDFDYVNNYDPITNSVTKEYKYSVKENFEIKPVSIILENVQTNSIEIQTGFYPKVINDFNVFYNGYDLYSGYTNDEIQKSINNGLVPYAQSNFQANVGSKTPITVQSFSVLLKNQIEGTFVISDPCPPINTTTGAEYFIVPSLGASFNQTKTECVDNSEKSVVDLTNNQSMYNGSVRLLWASPNYGYFDNSQITKPEPDSYINHIDNSGLLPQAPMYLFSENNYSNIEEIFSVFDKNILNKLEQEFLNFCKPISDIELGIQSSDLYTSLVDIEGNFKNFQALFRSLMMVTGNIAGVPINNFFIDTTNNQLSNVSNNIKSFMEYDVLLKYGNPSNFKRRIFESFLGDVIDPITFEPYVKNSLPSSNGGITLSQSKAKYPLEWVSLETEVGFSTINNIQYSNTGSYITDFFIDNNIKFTVENITILSPLIKIYATQKLIKPTIDNVEFKNLLKDYLSKGSVLQNGFINGIMNKLRVELSDQQQLPERTIQSVIDGQQSKVENYEVFKALNDKWISGSDFTTKTLFEDFMFLDRASRNIGDTVILDIFDVQNMLNENALNQTMSVFTFISGILRKNNFNVMPLPAYVNFYNVQDVDGTTTPNSEGSLEFANNMWGTFLNVDYRNSGPKLIAFYTGKPSENLDLPKGNFRFRDDGFNMKRSSENPLIENQQGKKDWAISNKCVGFNVDIGTRNQNIFYGFSVSQNAGKATSESLQAQLNMVDQANGRNVATQNNSIYNLYKQRSYQCTVQCFGNALLQPTMYFNLKHVPMFTGPYMITDVSHVITPGSFETTITGTRQSVYDLPVIENFLQSINRNLLTKIEALVVVKKDEPASLASAITDSGKSAKIIQNAGSTEAAQNTCTAKLNTDYVSSWQSKKAINTKITPKEFGDAIKRNVPNDTVLQTIIYLICYVRTYQGNVFNTFDYNFATITLDQNYGVRNAYFIGTGDTPTYSCVDVENTKTKNKNPLPIANFVSVDRFIRFMKDSLENRKNQILQNNYGLKKYYVCNWPSENISSDYYDNNIQEFTEVNLTFDKGLKSAVNDAGLVDYNAFSPKSPESSASASSSVIYTPSVTSESTKICSKPEIVSFSPITGTTNTILTIRGKYLDTTTGVTINNILVVKGIVKNLDGTRITLTVPKSNTQGSDPIVVKSNYGDSTSNTSFTYIL